MGIFGPPNVEKMKAKKDVRGLIKALGYQKDWDVRTAAAIALGEIGDTRAVEPLSAWLKHEWSHVREAAAKALGEIGDPRAVEPLTAALKDKDINVRRVAAKALGDIGDARAVEPLIATLKDEDGQVRKAVASALKKLGWKPEGGEAEAWYWTIQCNWEKAIALGSLAVEPLIAALKDGKRAVRKSAAEALGKVGDARAVEPLIAAFQKDNNRDVRKAAATALAKIGDPSAVEFLSAPLKGEDWDGERLEDAAEALGELGDPEPEAIDWLFNVLVDGGWDSIRKVAASSLLKLGKLEDSRTKMMTEYFEASWGILAEDTEKRARVLLELSKDTSTWATKFVVAELRDVMDYHPEELKKLFDVVKQLIMRRDDKLYGFLTKCVRESKRHVASLQEDPVKRPRTEVKKTVKAFADMQTLYEHEHIYQKWRAGISNDELIAEYKTYPVR